MALRLTMDFWAAGGGDVQRFLAAHEDLRDLLEGLLGDPDLRDGLGAPARTPDRVSPALPRLQGYTFERELGRGGMGVVYLAVQRSLGRRVALKLLSNPMLAHERALWRFQRESQLLAKLEHPGIVRILDAGVEDGTPFFAMEYVAGAPLSAVVDAVQRHGLATASAATVFAAVAGASDAADVPAQAPAAGTRSYVDLVLDLVAQVADALAFAHAAGVVHRDVKPSNVLVRPDGRVVLSDFGIARVDGGPTMTVTGDFTGTPYYVSPEQARRSVADHRSDLFSLGVLLFETLTLQRPFQGDDTAAVLDAIERREPVDPRRINPALSADVAAVVGKALAKAPGDRYQGGGALAADLRAAQQGLPVSARRPSAARRLLRWARREPWRATAATTALLAAATLVAVTVVFTDSLYRETQRTKAALLEAQTARTAAEANLDDAMAAVDEMLSQAGESDVAAVPQLVQVRKQMLQRALAFYARFAAREDDAPLVRQRAAVANAKVARVRRLLGDIVAAVELGTHAVRELAALRAHVPTDAGVGNALAYAQLNLASAQADLGHVDEARALLQDAVRTFAGFAAEGAADVTRRFGLAQVQYARFQLESLRTSSVAEQAAAQGLAEFERLAHDDPDNPRYRVTAADLRSEYAALLLRLGKTDEAEAQLVLARTQADEIGRLDAGRYDVRRLECTVRDQLVQLYKSVGRLVDAEAAALEAGQRWRALVTQFPQVPNSRALCLRSLIGLANIQRYLNEFQEADASATEAMGMAERLVAEFADSRDYQADLAVTLYNVGSIRMRHFDAATARVGTDLLQRSREMWETLHREDPANGELARFLAHTLNELGFASEQTAAWADAAATYERAHQVYADLTRLHPEVRDYQDSQANAVRGRGHAELMLGDARAALASADAALECLRQGLQTDARVPARRRFARLALELRAHACRELGDEAGVVAAATELAPLIDEPEDADDMLDVLSDGAAGGVDPSVKARADAVVALLGAVCAVDKTGGSGRLDDPRFAGLRGYPSFVDLQQARRR